MDNRIIKFRAWDKENKYMVLPTMGVAVVTFDGGIFEQADNAAGEVARTDWVLMQFTGLKDKNGKETYEGDLIKAGEMIYQIAWYGMNGQLMPFTTSPITTNQYVASAGVPIRNWNWLNGGSALNYQDIKKTVEVEVIGNIYENPELLK